MIWTAEWTLAQSRGVGYRSFGTSERVLSEYNKNFIFLFKNTVLTSGLL